MMLSKLDSDFLALLRSASIIVIVFGHVGGFWSYKPYSEFLGLVVPLFFFSSGAVSHMSFLRGGGVGAYYKKRFTGLLIPYILLCIFSLAVYLVVNKALPVINIELLYRWVFVIPRNADMPFPIGQVWFLHALIVITLLSPIYFYLLDKNQRILFGIFSGLAILGLLQHYYPINKKLDIFGNDLYKALIQSVFFVYGAFVFSSEKAAFRKLNWVVLSVSLSVSIALVLFAGFSVDIADHSFHPDFYYEAVSFFCISLVLLLRVYAINFMGYSARMRLLVFFLHKHTFSIFLLHTFFIFLVEEAGLLNSMQEKTIHYGLVKFSIVLLLTCFFSVPYTFLCQKVSGMLLK